MAVRVRIHDDHFSPAIRYIDVRWGQRWWESTTWTLNAASDHQPRPDAGGQNFRKLAEAVFHQRTPSVHTARWAVADYIGTAREIAALNREAAQLADKLADDPWWMDDGELLVDDDPWVQSIGDPLKAKTWHGIPTTSRRSWFT